MRRLYSTFAGGWPGLGLLLMRLVIGGVILSHVGPRLWSGPSLITGAGYGLLAVGALLLIAGLWTPVAGVMVTVAAMFEILTGEPPTGRVLAATIASALAMLGPGRISIDARLFGWKRIDARLQNSHSSGN